MGTFLFSWLQCQGKVVYLEATVVDPSIVKKNQNSRVPGEGPWRQAMPAALRASLVVCRDGLATYLMKRFCHQPKTKVMPQMVLGLKMEFPFIAHLHHVT